MSINQAIVPFFPIYFDAPAGVDRRQRQTTITQLLDLRAGIAWREWPYDARSDRLSMAVSPDPVRYMLDRGKGTAPGSRFHYSGAAPHLLSANITGATGLDAHAYAQHERLASLMAERPLSGVAPPKGVLDSKVRNYPSGTRSGDGRFEWPLSFDGKYVETLTLAQRPYAVRSARQDANTLLIELQDLQSSVMTRLKLCFEGDALQVDMSDGDGLRLLLRGNRG